MKSSKNKGEWSELYALLRIIDDTKLYAGDKDLNKVLDISYPVVEVFNGDESNFSRYQLDLVNQVVNVYIGESYDFFSVPISEFSKHADFLLNKIKRSKGSSFEIREIEDFIAQIKLYRITSSSSKKSDIQALIDAGNKTLVKLDFSIKSWLGSMPTLLNATGATNFIFEIKSPQELTSIKIENANKIKNFYNKFLYFEKHQIKLAFSNISR